MFEWIHQPEAWVALATLTALEIVLGIDNIIFISILVGRLPPEQRNKGRIFGLALAMITRILLLSVLAYIMKLSTPLFHIFDYGISGRDLIMFFGGLFLIGKSTTEIHNAFEEADDQAHIDVKAKLISVLVQIALIDIVFSLDSVITAVGMADDLMVMVIAIIISVLIMMVAAKSISDFVDNNPTVKMLALSFLILVGFALVAESFKLEIPKGYIYFAMAFSITVEMLNLRLRRKTKKIHLHKELP